MPVYEYKCTKCGVQFEVTQRITDAPLAECSVCGGELKRLITNTSFVLKGSGWYVTDYPSSDRKDAMKAEQPAGKDVKPVKSDSNVKDTRPDKKTDTKTAEATKTK